MSELQKNYLFEKKFKSLNPRLKIILGGLISISILIILIVLNFQGDSAKLKADTTDPLVCLFGFCGDGNICPGEECDDNNSTSGDGCSSTCQIEGSTPDQPTPDSDLSSPPRIISLSPLSGEAGDLVHINGENFNESAIVKFGNYTANINTIGHSAAGTMTIVASVPSVSQFDSYPVTVTTSTGTAISSMEFIIEGTEIGVPIISRIEPSSAAINSSIYIYGENFAETAGGNIIKFASQDGNNVQASTVGIVYLDGERVLKVVVPANATSGHVTVTVGSATADSGFDFQIVELKDSDPQIISISKSEVEPGEKIIIRGNGFIDSITGISDVIVMFDELQADIRNFSIDADNNDVLLIKVPANAKSGYITVTLNGKTAISPIPIVVSPVSPRVDESRSTTNPTVIKEDDPAISIYAFISDINGVNDIENVSIDLSSIGGSTANFMSAKEIKNGGQIFEITGFVLPQEFIPNKTYLFSITATDKSGHYGQGEVVVQSQSVTAESDTETDDPYFDDWEESSDTETDDPYFDDLEEKPDDFSDYYPDETITTIIKQDSEVTTAPESFLDAPINLTASLKHGGVQLSWSPVKKDTFQSYNIYYSTVSGNYLHRLHAGPVTNYLVSANLSQGQQYFFVITTVDDQGVESTPSNEVSIIFSLTYIEPTLQSSPAVLFEPPSKLPTELHAAAPIELSKEGPAEIFWLVGIMTLIFSSFSLRKSLEKLIRK